MTTSPLFQRAVKALLDLAQNQEAPIGRQLAAVKTGDNFFALDR
jgi:hypothetical protein